MSGKRYDFAQFFNKDKSNNGNFDKSGKAKKVNNANNNVKPRQLNASRKSN